MRRLNKKYLVRKESFESVIKCWTNIKPV